MDVCECQCLLCVGVLGGCVLVCVCDSVCVSVIVC